MVDLCTMNYISVPSRMVWNDLEYFLHGDFIFFITPFRDIWKFAIYSGPFLFKQWGVGINQNGCFLESSVERIVNWELRIVGDSSWVAQYPGSFHLHNICSEQTMKMSGVLSFTVSMSQQFRRVGKNASLFYISMTTYQVKQSRNMKSDLGF